MSPTAAQAQARRLIRTRFKSLRLGVPVESPRVVADRLVTYAQATAKAFPVEPNDAYRQYVQNAFSDRYLELCKVAPIPAKAGVR